MVLAVVVLGPELARAQRPTAQETERCTQAFEHGQEQRQQAQLLAARSSFDVCARPVCPAVVSKVCVRWLDELRSEVPRLTVLARDADGATVVLDGQPVGPAPASREVDPGTHRVTLRTARGEGPPVSVTVVASGAASVTVEGPPRLAPAASTPPAEPRSTGLLGPRGPGYALFGLGAVAIGAGAWLGLSTRADVEDRRDRCQQQGDCASAAEVDRLRTRLHVADALMGVGLVAGGVGLALFLHAGPSVAVAPRPGGVAALVRF